jgi:hypothetical protein
VGRFMRPRLSLLLRPYLPALALLLLLICAVQAVLLYSASSELRRREGDRARELAQHRSELVRLGAERDQAVVDHGMAIARERELRTDLEAARRSADAFRKALEASRSEIEASRREFLRQPAQ